MCIFFIGYTALCMKCEALFEEFNPETRWPELFVVQMKIPEAHLFEFVRGRAIERNRQDRERRAVERNSMQAEGYPEAEICEMESEPYENEDEELRRYTRAKLTWPGSAFESGFYVGRACECTEREYRWHFYGGTDFRRRYFCMDCHNEQDLAETRARELGQRPPSSLRKVWGKVEEEPRMVDKPPRIPGTLPHPHRDLELHGGIVHDQGAVDLTDWATYFLYVQNQNEVEREDEEEVLAQRAQQEEAEALADILEEDEDEEEEEEEAAAATVAVATEALRVLAEAESAGEEEESSAEEGEESEDDDDRRYSVSEAGSDDGRRYSQDSSHSEGGSVSTVFRYVG